MRSEMPCESYQAVLLASQRSSQAGQVLPKGRPRPVAPAMRSSDRPVLPAATRKKALAQFQSQPCPRAKAEAERATAQSTHHFTHALTGEYMA